MKFTCTIIIDKPRDTVVKYFSDPQYLGKYQEGFLRKVLISGELAQTDCVSKIYYRQGKGEMELTETILMNNFPEEFIGFYHHKNMDNTMKCTFKQLPENQTRYDSEIEYTEFRGFLINIMVKLFPGMFKKQVQKWLDNFKVFVESQ